MSDRDLLYIMHDKHTSEKLPAYISCDRITRGDALCFYRECGSQGITPKSPEFWVKGGDNVERIIKLVKALTELLRAITDLIRIFKA